MATKKGMRKVNSPKRAKGTGQRAKSEEKREDKDLKEVEDLKEEELNSEQLPVTPLPPEGGLRADAQLPVIHVVVRTHDRPQYFKKCIESIASQDYGLKVVHVICDEMKGKAYATAAMDAGLVDTVEFINPASVMKDLGDFKKLQAAGYCKAQSDYKKHFYDLYLNRKLEQITDGWIFIVDDDKVVPAGVLQDMGKIISAMQVDEPGNEDFMLIGQYKMKSRTLPIGEHWRKLPFTRAHVDMSCFVFNVKNKELARLDGHGAGDWRAANQLAKHLKVVWVERVFTEADNNGNAGKGE